jgi:hypothetical protein
VSQYLVAGSVVLWNPSHRVAQLFFRAGEAISPTVGVATGIAPEESDEYEIDLDTFTVFVDAVVRQYLTVRHPILRSLVEGYAATALVLVQRAGRSVAALTETPVPDSRDLSVGPDGPAPLGQVERLLALAAESARAMPT